MSPHRECQEADPFAILRGVVGQRPILVALAGPNGAGKTTFFHAYLRTAGLRYLCADEFANDLGINAYEASQVTARLREELVRQKESFVFETVLSDPVGDKVAFLKAAARSGYTVVLCFIGLSSPEISDQRVAMRVSEGGHDVPPEKIFSRYPRTMANLMAAVRDLPWVFLFDNDDLAAPFRAVALTNGGRTVWAAKDLPNWAAQALELPRERG